MNDLITVIVPVYNTENYLHRCINTLLNQSYNNLEIILVDDGSTDSSGRICDEYKEKDSRIIVLHQKNGGQSAARNNALNIARGKWVSFVDSDDFISHDYIEHLYGLCKKYNVRVAQCGYKPTTGSLPETSNIDYHDEIITLEEMYASKKRFFRGIVWSKIFDESLFREYRFPEGKIYEDEDASFKLLYESQYIALSNKCCYYYFQSDNSTTRGKKKQVSYDIIDIFEERLLFLESHKEYKMIDITEKELCIRIMLRYVDISKKNSKKEDTNKLWKEYVTHYRSIKNKKNIPIIEMLILWNFYHFRRYVTTIYRIGYLIRKTYGGIK